jgi:hypothetical protein
VLKKIIEDECDGVYVCMHACMYACVYVCMYVSAEFFCAEKDYRR